MQYPLRRPRRLPRFTPAQVLVLGFAGLILTGTFLLMLPEAQEVSLGLGFIDALFTATSAVCVTGLVVVDTATQFTTTGELIVLGLIQAGGLGIMTVSALMMLLMGRRISLKERLLMQEALGSFSIAGVVRLTRNIIVATVAIEGIGVLLLTLRWAGEMGWARAAYWGLFHAISGFNNAGFDLTSSSLRPFASDPFVIIVISVLIMLGGIGFLVMEDVWKNRLRWERLTLHTRLVLQVTGLLIVAGTLLFLATESQNPETFGSMHWLDKLTNAYFASVTPRTAGFETVMTGKMLDVSLFITIILMFVGASPGGTGGGIKTTTFSMIALTIRATATGREDVHVMGRKLPRELIDKAVTIAAIAMGLIAIMTSLLLLTEHTGLSDPSSGFGFIDVLFEVTSAFGTVGLSTGLTPTLSDAGKLLITLVMFVGRVGPLTMAVALAQRAQARETLHFPEDRVMIG